MKPPDAVPYALRLPKKVHVAMKKLAKESRRSLNAEIVIACQKHSGRVD